MKLLLDTHLLLRAAGDPESGCRRRRNARSSIRRTLSSSAPPASGRSRSRMPWGARDFRIEPRILRRGLLDNGYEELPITSEHTVSIDTLRSVHKDPFDRILIAQALTEGVILLTSDRNLARYGAPVRKV
jgi:PIN domain nuclease of toxin-antitoxin system